MVSISQQAKEELIRDAVVTYIREVAEKRTVEALIADVQRLIVGLDEALVLPSVAPSPALEG